MNSNTKGESSPDVPVGEIRDLEMAGAEHTFYKFRKSKDYTVADFVPKDKVKIYRDDSRNLVRIDLDYEPGDPQKKKEMDKAMNNEFAKMSRKLWDSFVTHGYAEEQEDGTFKMTKRVSDLDGESCLALLREAGLDTSNVKYVPQGEGGNEEGLIMDTANEDGILSRNSGETVIIDHHGEKSGRDTSATKFTYQFLLANGLLEQRDYYDDFVNFVTDEDNKTYFESDLRENFQKSWQTLRGLNQYIDPSDIIDLFKKSRESGKVFNPDEPFSEEFLESYTYKAKDLNNPTDAQNNGKNLKDLGDLVRDRIAKSEEAIIRLEREGFVFNTGNKNYGKILIDPGFKRKDKIIKSVPMGHDAVRAAGYGGYLIWSPLQNGFALFTTRPLGEIRFTQGKNIRGNFWLKPKNQETIQVTLEEIFSRLSKKMMKVPQIMKKALGARGLAYAAVKLPEGIELEFDSKSADESGKEGEADLEKKEVMGIIIGSYKKGGKEFKELIESGKIFKLSGTEEEKQKSLRERVEKYIHQGVEKYSRQYFKLENEEIEQITRKCIESIFT